MKKFAISNIVRIFANDIRDMEKKKDYTVTQEQLARFAKALGHPARIAIMHFLAKQKTCYFGDIHEELPIAKATVSQHLKELKDAGLIQGEVETPKVKYCINRENWQLARELRWHSLHRSAHNCHRHQRHPAMRCICRLFRTVEEFLYYRP